MAPLNSAPGDTSSAKKPKPREGVFVVENGVAVFRPVKVGIAGDEDNPANLLFYTVVAVGFVGTIVALARPGPMAWVMGAMAVLQMSVGIATLSIDVAVIPATLLFTSGWIIAAALFHRAAGDRARRATGS